MMAKQLLYMVVSLAPTPRLRRLSTIDGEGDDLGVNLWLEKAPWS